MFSQLSWRGASPHRDRRLKCAVVAIVAVAMLASAVTVGLAGAALRRSATAGGDVEPVGCIVPQDQCDPSAAGTETTK